jgi:hypothetical protein
MLKLGIYEDILPKELFEKCLNYSNQNKSNLENREGYLVALQDFDILNEIKIYFKENIDDVGEIKEINFIYSTNKNIVKWNNDNKYDGEFTIYMNENWNRDYGGLFLFEDQKYKEMRAIIPRNNMAIERLGNIWYSQSGITKENEIFKSLQILYTSK